MVGPIKLAEKRLPLGGWALLVMLLSGGGGYFGGEQSEAMLRRLAESNCRHLSTNRLLVRGSDLADPGRRFTKFQRGAEASGCNSHLEAAGWLRRAAPKRPQLQVWGRAL